MKIRLHWRTETGPYGHHELEAEIHIPEKLQPGRCEGVVLEERLFYPMDGSERLLVRAVKAATQRLVGVMEDHFLATHGRPIAQPGRFGRRVHFGQHSRHGKVISKAPPMPLAQKKRADTDIPRPPRRKYDWDLIWHLRKETGMSWNDIAREVGCDKSTAQQAVGKMEEAKNAEKTMPAVQAGDPPGGEPGEAGEMDPPGREAD